jgi:hypothetical protein
VTQGKEQGIFVSFMPKAKRSYVASYYLLFKPLSFGKLFLQAFAQNVSRTY